MEGETLDNPVPVVPDANVTVVAPVAEAEFGTRRVAVCCGDDPESTSPSSPVFPFVEAAADGGFCGSGA